MELGPGFLHLWAKGFDLGRARTSRVGGIFGTEARDQIGQILLYTPLFSICNENFQPLALFVEGAFVQFVNLCCCVLRLRLRLRLRVESCAREPRHGLVVSGMRVPCCVGLSR